MPAFLPAVRCYLSVAAFTCAIGSIFPPAIAQDATARANGTALTLEKLFGSDEWNEKNVGSFVWRKSGEGYFALIARDGHPGKDLVLVDPQSGRQETWVAANELMPSGSEKPLSIESFEWSADESQLLIFTDSRKVWRRNTRGNYWLWERKTKTLHRLGGSFDDSTMMFAKFSPDGRHVSFVRKHNIYIQDCKTLAIRALTTDGSSTIINGTSDWVYEEELDLRDAYRWSSDSQAIAYWQLDTSGVRIFHLINNTDDLYSKPIPIVYPKVGERNSAARVGIVRLDGSQTVWVDLPGEPRDHYISQCEWLVGQHGLLLQRLNRLQNQLIVYRVDPTSGAATQIMKEEDSSWLENENPFRWVGASHFLWLSERNGWRTPYLSSIEKESGLQRVVQDEMDLISVDAIDQTNGILYLSASPKNATHRYLYRVSLSGGKTEKVTPEEYQGWNTYSISPNHQWALHTFSKSGVPPTISMIRMPSHERVRVLEDNASLKAKLKQLDLPTSKFVKLDIGQDVVLDGWCIEPRQATPHQDTPLFMHVYGEPHGQTVKDAWTGKQGIWHRWLAQQGYMVASVDNRGTQSPRGRAWRKIVHRQIGTLASADQAAATQALLKLYPELRPKRIGIWGWSGGGSMSLNAIFRYPELYHLAIAVAPVPNQLLYDTIYQERYMGLPQDNAEGYKQGSPITHAHRLEGKLLVIHGTGDDNCHYQGVEQLIDELVKHNKQFQVLPYPNRSHSIHEGSNTTRHLYESMTRFLMENLPPVPGGIGLPSE